MIKRRHPADRYQRRLINERKKAEKALYKKKPKDKETSDVLQENDQA